MHRGCVCAGEWAGTGTACLLGGVLAPGLCVLAQRCVCARAGCAFAHGSGLARGRAHLHSTAGRLVRERVLAGGCVLAQTCACARVECAFAHGSVLVRGLCVLTGAVCPCTRAVCSHQGPAHTLPLQPVRSLAQGLARGRDTCPCPRSSGDTLARARLPLHMRGDWAPAAVLTREGVCAPRTGMRAETGGGNAGPSRSGTFCTSAHKRVCTLTGVCTPLVQVCKLTGVRACLRMSAHARKRVHACVHLQTRVHALASAQVSFAPGCTLPREVCAQRGGADRIWRVSGWQGGPWWVQGWWGDMVTGCPGAMVMGRCGARVVG